MSPQKTKVNLNHLVTNAVSFLESQCLSDGIVVKVTLSPNVPEIDADPSQLNQVVVNLVVNAMQAMPEGGRLNISTVRDRTKGALAVEDTGTGMDDTVLQKIFTPFFTTKDAGLGTGLGLPVVHLLHLRVHPLAGNLSIAGYGYVPPTSFLIKDWERLDSERAAVPERSYQACSSAPGGIIPVDAREWFVSHNTISEDLAALARLSEPASTIYVIHTPPFGTTLDVLHSGRHAGSRSVRRFIEEFAPPLTLHGHIHESHHITKELMDRIGNTICVNAGQTEEILHAVIVDLPGYTVRRV